MNARFLLAVSMLSMGTGAALAVNVPAGGNIQAAIDQAAPGEVVQLAAGSYNVSSSLLINKSITLRGVSQNGTVLNKTNASNQDIAAIVSNADNVNINSFTMRGHNVGGPCILLKGDNQSLDSLAVTDCGNDIVPRSGILLDTSNFDHLTNLFVTGHRMVGISESQSSGTVIDRVTSNSNGAEGLTVDIGSHNVHVSNSSFINNNTRNAGVGGIGVDASNGTWIMNSTISGTQFLSGITMQNNVGGEDGAIFRNNVIQNNAGYAILARNCQYPVTHFTSSPNTYGGNHLQPDVFNQCPWQ